MKYCLLTEVAKMTEIRFFEFLHKLKMNLRKERGGNPLKGQNFNKDISKLFKDILPFTVLYFKQISLAIRKLFICFIHIPFELKMYFKKQTSTKKTNSWTSLD